MNPFAHLDESLSASRIGTYLRCPLRYYFSYVQKLPWERLGASLILGSAVDRAAKEAVLQVKQGWSKPGDLDLREIFDRFLKIEMENPRAPIAWGSRLDPEGAKLLGRDLMEALEPVLFTEERIDRITGVDVAFTVPLLDDEGQPLLPVPLVGVFDMCELVDGRQVPLELKTASNRTQFLPANLGRDIQALIYGLAARTLAGDGPARVRYVSAVKLKNPEVIESENVVTEDQLRWIRGVVVGVKRAIVAGVFVAAPSQIECGGCPFQQACAASGGMVRTSPARIFSGTA